ncbi:uncharacterized protein LOC129570784 isoform X2 [Sitodiplosis mosellana]|nr:uncharacterized protein LOC129570784 isoform X2 [Sitodiplosis mosellana]
MDSIKKFFRSMRLTKKPVVLPKPELSLELYEIPLPGPSQIFKLTVDCFDEIFDYLSLTELHSFAQTCLAMQRIAGAYFIENYKSTKTICDKYGIHTEYSYNEDGTLVYPSIKSTAFNPYITIITREFNPIKPLRLFQSHSHEFTSLNHIYLNSNVLDTAKIKCLETILPQLEVIKLLNCSVEGDVYDMLLKFCVNLKKFFVQDDNSAQYPIVKKQTNSWLLREYPLLEMIQLIQRDPFRINELTTFLEMNPTIRTFSISSGYLWKNRQELLESNAKLEKLEIHDYYGNLSSLQELCSFLNQLHERGFFKRLHIFDFYLDEDDYRQLASLEAFSVKYFNVDYLSHLTQLKELLIWKDENDLEIEMELLAKGLVNLRTVFIDNALLDDVLQFIRHSVSVNKIRVEFDKGQGALDLKRLNDERKRLVGACKVAIYVTTDIFLSTKWAAKNGDLNLWFVEIRRADWYGWDHYYDMI